MKGLKKFFHRERRRFPRHPVCVDVEFYVWDTAIQKSRTGKAKGCLTAISIKGACLQTNHLQLGGHHLFLDNDPRGRTVLMMELPSPSGEGPWKVQAKIISYDKHPDQRRYQFDIRLQFVNLSPADLKSLEQLIRPKSFAESNHPSP